MSYLLKGKDKGLLLNPDILYTSASNDEVGIGLRNVVLKDRDLSVAVCFEIETKVIPHLVGITVRVSVVVRMNQSQARSSVWQGEKESSKAFMLR